MAFGFLLGFHSSQVGNLFGGRDSQQPDSNVFLFSGKNHHIHGSLAGKQFEQVDFFASLRLIQSGSVLVTVDGIDSLVFERPDSLDQEIASVSQNQVARLSLDLSGN